MSILRVEGNTKLDQCYKTTIFVSKHVLKLSSQALFSALTLGSADISSANSLSVPIYTSKCVYFFSWRDSDKKVPCYLSLFIELSLFLFISFSLLFVITGSLSLSLSKSLNNNYKEEVFVILFKIRFQRTRKSIVASQCDQIGRFLKFLMTFFLSKVAQMHGEFLG